jgi:hypothetical protein
MIAARASRLVTAGLAIGFATGLAFGGTAALALASPSVVAAADPHAGDHANDPARRGDPVGRSGNHVRATPKPSPTTRPTEGPPAPMVTARELATAPPKGHGAQATPRPHGTPGTRSGGSSSGADPDPAGSPTDKLTGAAMSGMPNGSPPGPADSAGPSLAGFAEGTDSSLGSIIAVGLGGAGVIVVGGWFAVARRRASGLATANGEAATGAPGSAPVRTTRPLLVAEDRLVAELERARRSRGSGSSYGSVSPTSTHPTDPPRPLWVRRLDGHSVVDPERSDQD